LHNLVRATKKRQWEWARPGTDAPSPEKSRRNVWLACWKRAHIMCTGYIGAKPFLRVNPPKWYPTESESSLSWLLMQCPSQHVTCANQAHGEPREKWVPLTKFGSSGGCRCRISLERIAGMVKCENLSRWLSVVGWVTTLHTMCSSVALVGGRLRRRQHCRERKTH
jgi:hypothetical protein